VSTGPSDDDAARRRAVRRRHLHERQAVIFGTLISALAAAALLGLGVYVGAIPAPFDVPFKSPPAADGTMTPCPPEGALPVAYADITVNVYNGTRRTGLAGSTAQELAARGLAIGQQANDPRGRYDGATLIRTGPAGIASAYTVAAIFPGAVVVLDSRGDATVDVTLGAAFDAMLPPDQAALDPAVPLAAPADCVPVVGPTGAATAVARA
jgi:hypothetical protein